MMKACTSSEESVARKCFTNSKLNYFLHHQIAYVSLTIAIIALRCIEFQKDKCIAFLSDCYHQLYVLSYCGNGFQIFLLQMVPFAFNLNSWDNINN